jgi:tryptophan-rich sensory protein
MLLSLAFSNGISDAIGIYYSSYVNDNDYSKAVREAFKTLVVNALIPFVFAVVFILVKNLKYGSLINIALAFILFMYVNMMVFTETNKRLFNLVVFILIIGGNYIIGSTKLI